MSPGNAPSPGDQDQIGTAITRMANILVVQEMRAQKEREKIERDRVRAEKAERHATFPEIAERVELRNGQSLTGRRALEKALRIVDPKSHE